MFRNHAMRLACVLTTGLVLAAAASSARAECDSRVTCIGPVSLLVSDPVSRNTFFRIKSGDEADLSCNLSGPPVIGATALRLSRNSKAYYENYQVLIIAAVTTLTVRVTMKDPAPAGICEIDTLVLEPYY